jgi:hypothetical protein
VCLSGCRLMSMTAAAPSTPRTWRACCCGKEIHVTHGNYIKTVVTKWLQVHTVQQTLLLNTLSSHVVMYAACCC